MTVHCPVPVTETRVFEKHVQSPQANGNRNLTCWASHTVVTVLCDRVIDQCPIMHPIQ